MQTYEGYRGGFQFSSLHVGTSFQSNRDVSEESGLKQHVIQSFACIDIFILDDLYFGTHK